LIASNEYIFNLPISIFNKITITIKPSIGSFITLKDCGNINISKNNKPTKKEVNLVCFL